MLPSLLIGAGALRDGFTGRELGTGGGLAEIGGSFRDPDLVAT